MDKKKVIIGFALTSVAVIAIYLMTRTEYPSWYDGDPTMGDLNDDGIRNGEDIQILTWYLFGYPIDEISPLSEAEFLRRADINKDDKIDNGDITALRWIMTYIEGTYG